MKNLTALTAGLLLTDTLQTAYAIVMIGLHKEANPIARELFALPLGFGMLFIVRIFSLWGMVWLIERYPKLKWALTFCIVVLALVVVNNFLALLV